MARSATDTDIDININSNIASNPSFHHLPLRASENAFSTGPGR